MSHPLTRYFSRPFNDFLFFYPYCSSALITPFTALILFLLLVFDTLAALSLPIESWTIDIVNNDYTRRHKSSLLFINFLFIVHAGRRVPILMNTKS